MLGVGPGGSGYTPHELYDGVGVGVKLFVGVGVGVFVGVGVGVFELHGKLLVDGLGVGVGVGVGVLVGVLVGVGVGVGLGTTKKLVHLSANV